MTTRIDPTQFVGHLHASGLDVWAGVPDSLLKDLCAAASEKLGDRFVISANEGNAVGAACGWYVGTGRPAVVYMQNSGEGNAVNPLLSIADPDVYSIPMLLVIGWRGEPGVHDEPQHVKQGKATCALLEAMGVPYEVLDPDGWRGQLEGLLGAMRSQSRPMALVVRKGSFGAYPFSPADDGAPMTREGALEALLGCLGEDDLVVSTTGKTSREVFEIRERRGQGHAYGMALGTDADVWCVDGDGSLLMHMGAFPVMAQKWPENLKYLVNVNGAHESVGGQPTVGLEMDVPGMLRACGIAPVAQASTPGEIEAGVSALRDGSARALVLTTRQGSRADLGRPTTTPKENKEAMMAKIASMREEG